VRGPAPPALLGGVGAGVGGLAAAGRATAAVSVQAQAGQEGGHDGLVLLRERGRQLLVVRLAHRQQRHVLRRARLRARAQGFPHPAPGRPLGALALCQAPGEHTAHRRPQQEAGLCSSGLG